MTQGPATKEKPKIVWCKPCTGEGWCMVGEAPYECMCGHLRRVRSGMPEFVRTANVQREHVKLPLLQRTAENLFVEATWSDMRAVVKILQMVGTHGHIEVADEPTLRNVYVGSTSKASKSVDYDGVIYNSIADYAGPPALLVIRLNTLSNKNKAMPGVLMEAVRLRVDYGKPTWLLSDHDRPFNQSSHSFSEELMGVVVSDFKKVMVPRINKADQELVREFLSQGLDADPAQQEIDLPTGPIILKGIEKLAWQSIESTTIAFSGSPAAKDILDDFLRNHLRDIKSMGNRLRLSKDFAEAIKTQMVCLDVPEKKADLALHAIVVHLKQEEKLREGVPNGPSSELAEARDLGDPMSRYGAGLKKSKTQFRKS